MPRVSVIVPAFNAANSIEDALRSVLAQTYEDWEVVVVDDASDDDTADRARAVSDRVTVIRANTNGGPAMARNLGVARARGEVVAFLDADDRWLPDYLESQLEVLKAHGDGVGVVACDAYIEDAHGGRLSETYRDQVPFPARVTVDRLLEGNPVFISALVPRAVVQQVGGFDPRTYGSEDHDLWLRIVERGWRVVENPRALVIYRLADASVSSRRSGMARTNQTTYRLALERGYLTARQRRSARRRLRLQVGVEHVESVLEIPKSELRARDLWRLARGAVQLGAFAVLRPARWPHWARTLIRQTGPWRSPLR